MKIIKVMVILDTASRYGRDFLRGVFEYSKIKGNWSISSDIDFHLASERKDWQQIWNADAVIAHIYTQKELDEVREMGVPAVILSAMNFNLDTPLMLTDDKAVAEMAAEHLLSRGFKNFAYCGWDEYYWSRNREQFFIKYLQNKKFNVHIFKPVLDKKGEISFTDERKQMIKWLKSLPKPLGFFGCNDNRCQEVIETCRLANINVPEDIAIIGVDNDYFNCELTYISLTSISLDTFTSAFQAAKLLDAKIKNKRTKDYIIPIKPTHVAVRRSTDIYAIADREVANALRLIVDNSRKIIQVSDVVASTSLSRRVLEKHFRQTLGRSILEEIRNKKVAEISKMLTQTSYTISEIAEATGFNDTKHFYRYFSNAVKMSPSLYRNKFVTSADKDSTEGYR